MAIFLVSDIFQKLILPFVLIFALVFAILQKSELLGKDKRQIDAIVGFVIGAIFITFSTYVEWVNQFIIFFVIALFVLFVFMLLYSFAYGNKTGDPLQSWVKTVLGVVFALAVIVALAVITGAWEKVQAYPDLGVNILFGAIILGAIVAVLYSSKKNGDKKE